MPALTPPKGASPGDFSTLQVSTTKPLKVSGEFGAVVNGQFNEGDRVAQLPAKTLVNVLEVREASCRDCLYNLLVLLLLLCLGCQSYGHIIHSNIDSKEQTT